jgi:hypothetical protein
MDTPLSSVAGVVTAAGTNPLALVALLALVAAWLVIALKVRRNHQLLKYLNQLPDKDRLKALQMEMGVVTIRGGLSPEQWLKHNMRTYYFFGFAILCLTLVILAAMGFYIRNQKLKPGVDVSLYNQPAPVINVEQPLAGTPPGETPQVSQNSRSVKGSTQQELIKVVKVNVVWGPKQMAEDEVPQERVITYASSVQNGVSHITYQLPYLEQVRRGKHVSGVNYLGSPFKWRFPELSVKVVNNTEQTLVLSRAFFHIVSSQVDEEPIPVVEDLSINQITFHNEGWGEVTNPVVRFSISEEREQGEVSLFAEEEHRCSLQTFPKSANIPIEPYLPPRLRDASIIRSWPARLRTGRETPVSQLSNQGIAPGEKCRGDAAIA